MDSYTELYHHGVKGQRWGVRRYQNPDGSLTLEGYQHWGLNPDGSKFRGGKVRGYTDATVSASNKGALAGATAGAALGSLGGVAGSLAGMSVGLISGAMVGTAAGAINSHRMRRKIKKILKENGTVYVKDL